MNPFTNITIIANIIRLAPKIKSKKNKINPRIFQWLRNLFHINKQWYKIAVNNLSILCSDILFYNSYLPFATKIICTDHNITIPLSAEYVAVRTTHLVDLSQHENIKNISAFKQNITLPLSAKEIRIRNCMITNPDLSKHEIKNIVMVDHCQKTILPEIAENIMLCRCKFPIIIPRTAKELGISSSAIVNPDLSHHTNLKNIRLIYNKQHITIPLSAEYLDIYGSMIANPDLSQHKNLKIIKLTNNYQPITIPLSAEYLYMFNSVIANPDLSQHKNLKHINICGGGQNIITPLFVDFTLLAMETTIHGVHKRVNSYFGNNKLKPITIPFSIDTIMTSYIQQN